MTGRWGYLFWPGLATLLGIAWLFHRIGTDLSSWWHLSLIAVIVGTIVAFVAMVKSYPHKWPAAIVLICVGPMLLELFPEYHHWPALITMEPPFAIVLLGPVVTAIAAVCTLIARPPQPPPDDPVPRAAIVD